MFRQGDSAFGNSHISRSLLFETPEKGVNSHMVLTEFYVVPIGFEANSVCSVRNGDCEQICLATPNGPQCACENGFTTAKTCSIPTCE